MLFRSNSEGGREWTAFCSALERCPDVRRIEVSGVCPDMEEVVKTILGKLPPRRRIGSLSREDGDSERRCVVEVKYIRVLF